MARVIYLVFLHFHAAAHRPMVNGVSCGQRFGSATDPLEVPDLEEYWGAHRVVTCDAPVFWVNFSVSGNVKRFLDISAGSLHPFSSFRSNRLWDLRIDALVLAPGLPVLDTSSLEIDVPAGSSGVLLQSADDASTCRHAETGLNVKVYQGLCGYFDNFGSWGVYSSVLLDRHVEVDSPGLVAFWLRGLRTGKFWVMLGAAGPETEDLIGSRRIPKASCEDCGRVDPSRPGDAFSGHADFWELWTPPGEGLPLVTQCAGNPSRESYCSLQSTTTSTSTTTTTTTTPSASATSTGSAQMSTTTSSDDALDSTTSSDDPSGSSSQPQTTRQTTRQTTVATTRSSTSSASTTQVTTLGNIDGMGCGTAACAFRHAQEVSMWRMQQAMAIEFVCDPAIDFVRGMIPHHQGAVDMCAALDGVQTWSEVGVVHFCNHVALDQNWEVRGMRQWLQDRNLDEQKACSGDCNSEGCDTARAFQAANEKMHKAMTINYTCRVEEDFIQAMLPHHQGAVDMCAVVLTSSTDSYLLSLCTNITRLQTAEMSWMKDWLDYKGLPVGASCRSSIAQSYCADLMPITDVCHDMGGDGLCDCTTLTDSCSQTATAGSRRFAVSMVCRRSCGLCQVEKTAADIVIELLRLEQVTEASTTSKISWSDLRLESTTSRPKIAIASGVSTSLLGWLHLMLFLCGFVLGFP